MLDSDAFGVYIEQEPYVREIIEAYMASKFKTVLEILERYSVRPVLGTQHLTIDSHLLTISAVKKQTRHLVDIYLSAHVVNLTSLIRSRALVLYFQPFASIKLESLSAAFGWSPKYSEQQVIGLIQSGEIQARVDKQNKVSRSFSTLR